MSDTEMNILHGILALVDLRREKFANLSLHGLVKGLKKIKKDTQGNRTKVLTTVQKRFGLPTWKPAWWDESFKITPA
jgi:hypothetical protein